MGSVISCCTKDKSTDNENVVKGQKATLVKYDGTKPIKLEQSKTTDVSDVQPIDASGKTKTTIHTAEEILDEDFSKKIMEMIEEYTASLSDVYQTERNRIVETMKSSPQQPYFGLVYSDYPEKNGLVVNDMARRKVTSEEVQQQLIDQIDKNIEPVFQSRTTDWNDSQRETTRPVIRAFIERHVNESFDRLKFD